MSSLILFATLVQAAPLDEPVCGRYVQLARCYIEGQPKGQREALRGRLKRLVSYWATLVNGDQKARVFGGKRS